MVSRVSPLACSALLLLLCAATPVFAIDYYVDSACSVAGNGRADSCASAAGGAGAFRDPQACFDSVRAGDTCYLKNGSGTYVTSNGTERGEDQGFRITHSGTAGNPITIRNYPGHRPVLAPCPDGSTTMAACNRATITLRNESYVRITGFRVRGLLEAYCDPPGTASGLCRGLEIDHMEISGGYGPSNDGNWSGIWVSNHSGARLHHNYIHDITLLTGSGTQSSASCIKLFTSIDGIYEYNTCDNVNVASQAGCFDDKQDAIGNTWRHNYCVNAVGGIRLQNQDGSISGMSAVASNVAIYQNVFILGFVGGNRARDCLRFEAAGFDGIQFYNNTCVGFTNGHQVLSQDGMRVQNIRIWNNAFAGMTARNIESFQDDYIPVVQNYNAYTAGREFNLGGSVRSFAEWRAASSLDGGSIAVSNFGFAGSTPGSEYQLAANSPLKNAGRLGGTSGGSPIDIGAYVNGITCVGHWCDSSVPVPRPPTNLRIIR